METASDAVKADEKDAQLMREHMQNFMAHVNYCLVRNHGKLADRVLAPMLEEGLKITEIDGRPVVVLQCLCPHSCFWGKNISATAPLQWEEIASELLPDFCLGAFTTPLPETLRTHYGLESGEGLWVEYVVPNSPAHRAGIHRGDILLEAALIWKKMEKLSRNRSSLPTRFFSLIW